MELNIGEKGPILLVEVILVTFNKTNYNSHASLSPVSHVLSRRACVHVKHCFPPAVVVGVRRRTPRQPGLPPLTRLREGGHLNYMIHRAPNSPYSSQLTFINYSLLFLETAFWVSFPALLALAVAREQVESAVRLSLGLNAAEKERDRHAHVAPGAVEQCRLCKEGDEINMSGGGHLQCSNVGTAHAISSKQGRGNSSPTRSGM